MFRVEVPAVVPLIVTDAGDKVQVGRNEAPAGDVVSAQVSATAPVKPPEGVRVSADEEPEPGATVAGLAAAAASVKSPGMVAAVTVKVTGAVCAAADPEGGVAVTVTVYAPTVVVAVVAMFKVAVPAVVSVIDTEVGAGVQVGRLVAPVGPVTVQVSATAPVNPPAGVTVNVEVAVPPAGKLAGLAAVAVRAMLGVGVPPVTVRVTGVV